MAWMLGREMPVAAEISAPVFPAARSLFTAARVSPRDARAAGALGFALYCDPGVIGSGGLG